MEEPEIDDLESIYQEDGHNMGTVRETCPEPRHMEEAGLWPMPHTESWAEMR